MHNDSIYIPGYTLVHVYVVYVDTINSHIEFELINNNFRSYMYLNKVCLSRTNIETLK